MYLRFFLQFFMHLNIFKQNLKGFLLMFYVTKTFKARIFYVLKTFLGNNTGKRLSNSIYVLGKWNRNVTLPYITFLKRSRNEIWFVGLYKYGIYYKSGSSNENQGTLEPKEQKYKWLPVRVTITVQQQVRIASRAQNLRIWECQPNQL